MNQRTVFQLLLCLGVACLTIIGCGEKGSEQRSSGKAEVFRQSEPLEHFKRQNPERDIIKWVEADLNDDGRRDCIILYRLSEDMNMMRVILDLESGYLDTNEVPAPISDQVIQLRDIDRKPPLEFIVQGTKGAKMGFAVFRIEDNRIVDLFGEGMEDCC